MEQEYIKLKQKPDSWTSTIQLQSKTLSNSTLLQLYADGNVIQRKPPRGGEKKTTGPTTASTTATTSY